MDQVTQLQEDCMTLALRLYAEDADTFSPETLEVMNRWRPKCDVLLRGGSMQDAMTANVEFSGGRLFARPLE